MPTLAIRNKKAVRILVVWLIAVISSQLIVAGADVSAAPIKQDNLCELPFEPVSLPLPELAGLEYVRMDGEATGFTGGLYPDGTNQPPQEHLNAGLNLAHQIVPLDKDGNPDPQDGQIGLLSLGMSNTAIEFGAFTQLVENNPQVNSQILFINGAISGATSDRWLNPDSEAWTRLANKVGPSGLQVQVAWVKLTQVQGGNFPEKAQSLQADLVTIVQHMKSKFPNLKIVYLSSRTRSYTTWRGLSPEPVAFETGFAVKWLIEQQINADPQLNYNPDDGEVLSPYLTWGPYLWIDGQNPREDGRVWLQEDLRGDCTHPSESGADKVAEMMLEFFLNDPTAQVWFPSKPLLVSTHTLSPTETPEVTSTESPTASITPTETQPSATLTPGIDDELSIGTQSAATAQAVLSSSQTIEPTPQQNNERNTLFWLWLVSGGVVILGVVIFVVVRRRP